jgi:hypothetical protein
MCRVTLILVAVLACFTVGLAQSETGLEGTISIGPIHAGPTRADSPGSGPLANTTFEVKSEDAVVASFTTDDQGKFRISLAPGRYTVMRKGEKPAVGFFGPFNIDVVAGKMAEVEWECDSGRR